MIELLLTLLLVVVIIYVLKLVLDMIPLPPQVKTIAWIIIGLIVLLFLLDLLGVYTFGGRL